MNEVNGIKLIATGHAAPARVVANDDLKQYVETSDEWIARRTGIRERRFVGEGESVLSLSCAAARQAMERSGIDPRELACVLVATVSWEQAMPSMACMLHGELGLPEDVPAADVNAACAGFLYALELARGMMLANGKRYALVVGGEAMSTLLNMGERETCVLFGDGAGAAVIELASDAPYASVLGARASTVLTAWHADNSSPSIHMDGAAVYRFAVSTVPEVLTAMLKKAGLTLDDVDYVVCHQANERIIDACVRALHAPAEKFYKNVAHWGNTCAASVPIALDELMSEGKLTPGMRIACVGFGAGLSWAAALLTV